MIKSLNNTIQKLDVNSIAKDRLPILKTVIDFIKEQKQNNKSVNLNFICTHNSRRSHLSQIWAQTMAAYYNIADINCYSGGTEATAMFKVVGDTLKTQGFSITTLSSNTNPIYSIKYAKNNHPIIAFSKVFDHSFNPTTDFAAIMTCSHADENCPFIAGALKRIPLRYKDPKAFDNTPIQLEKYLERSIQIATEMKYIFSKLTTDEL